MRVRKVNNWEVHIVERDKSLWELVNDFYGEKVYLPSIKNTVYLINIRTIGIDKNKGLTKGMELVMPPLDFCWKELGVRVKK